MKLLVLVCLLSLVFSYSFEDYITEFNKVYTSDEERQMRKQLFEKRMAEFQIKNTQGNSFTLGATKWTDRTDQQIQALLPVLQQGNRVSSSIPTDNRRLRASKTTDGLDYRGTSVSRIKDQGSCGGCWAFAAAATFESLKMLKNQPQKDISEQYIVQCTKNGNTCQGGQIDDALELLKATGAPEQTAFPYTSYNYQYFGTPNTQGICTANRSNFVKPFDNSEVISIYDTNMSTILKLLEYSPVATSIIADANFMNYRSGIFKCNYTYAWYMVNHAIQIVGYNLTGNYYIIKNSWGTSWGVNGYGFVDMTQDCYVRQRAHQLIWEYRLWQSILLLVLAVIMIL